MRTFNFIPFLIGFCLLAATGCSGGTDQASIYRCPMHPQVTSDQPGTCSICGMNLVKASFPEKKAETLAEGSRKVTYICPMHPQVVSDHPGSCPVCDMNLVQHHEVGGTETVTRDGGLASVVVPPERRAEIGLTLGTAEMRSIHRAFTAPARVVPDETRIFRIISRIDGYVDGLSVDYAGRTIRKGDPLASVYNLSYQNIFQQILSTPASGDPRRRGQPSERPTQDPVDGSLVPDAVRQRLRFWNMGDEQIDRILATGKPEPSIILVSPSSGFVTEKNAVIGQKVNPGDLLFVITDLSRVWAQAEVSELDTPSVHIGMPLVLTLRSLPGHLFQGKVKFFLPVVDPQTAVMKVVAEVPNPGLLLKPGMIGTAHLDMPEAPALSIPEAAALRTGERTYVFVDVGGNRLDPREVVLGAHGAGHYEVLSGLKEGDKVVTSANFLVDSESSLKAALLAASAK